MFRIGEDRGVFFLTWRHTRWPQQVNMSTRKEAQAKLKRFKESYPNNCFDLLVGIGSTLRKHIGWRWTLDDGRTNTIIGFGLAECKKMLRRKLQRNKTLPRGTTWEKYYG